MNNRKLKILFGMMLIAILALSCTLMACGEKETGISGISITTANPPRANYVQGQELDTSVGTITAMIDGEAYKVPFNAEGVTISGYDSTVLGKQTVTVTYKGHTTTFEVNVVPRVTAEEYETAYLIGEEFNVSKGRLKLTNDDGSITTVNFNNPAVKVKTFDSSKAGETEVTVLYTDSSNVEYNVNFKVTVYGIGEVLFKGPTKTTYWSHDTELSLDGGYLTIKADGNDSLTKMIELKTVEFSGFDPSQATKEYLTKPFVQVVTFSYAGKTFEHKISITYSPISLVIDAAKELSVIDFTKADVTVTAEQGELAVTAISEYLGLTQAKKNQIDAKDVEAVARPAALYLMEKFKVETDRFSDSFNINDNGEMVIMAGSYESMKKAATALSDPEDLFNVYAKLLRKMDGEFKNVTYIGTAKISDHIVVTTEDEHNKYLGVFECLTGLHEALANIPDDWTVDMLEQYASDINTAVYQVTSSTMVGYEYTDVFDIVRGWREKEDCFDIIYAYYCYVAKDGHDFITKNIWLKLPPPNALREWYSYFFNALYLVQNMDDNALTGAYLSDTTDFMYYYYKTCEVSNRILSGDDQFAIDLYNIIAIDKYIESNLYKATGGYIYQAGSMLSSETFEEMWETYLILVELNAYGPLDPDTHAKEFEAIFKALSSLTPSEMYGFISSLQCLYARESGNFYAFDYSQSYKSKLIAYVSAYYEYKLPQNAKASLQHLMIAMESYAAYEVFGAEIDADEKFIASIESIVSILSGLSSEEREVFDGLIGDCYDKYFALYQTLKNVNAPNVDKYEDQIKDICTSVSVFNDVAATLTDEELTSAEITERLVFMFALYEKVEYMYGMLADTNDAQLFAALASTELEFKDMKSTLDMAVYNMRKTFISCALSYKVTEKDSEGNQKTLLLWDAYDRTDIDLFFRDVARLFEHRFIGTAISKEYVDEIMAACRSLSDLDATILYGIGLNCYYNSLHTFYANALKIEYETKYGQSEETTAKIKEATDLTTALFEAEIAYRRYLQNSDSEDLANNFIQKMDKAAELYKTLNDADIRDAFFKTMYEYYLGIYNEMTK